MILCSSCSKRTDKSCEKTDCWMKGRASNEAIPKYYCAIAGTVSSGKTFYLLTLLSLINNRRLKYGDVSISFQLNNTLEVISFEEHLKQLQNNKVGLTPPNSKVEPYTITITVSSIGTIKKCDVVLFNTSGEIYDNLNYLRNNISHDISECHCCLYIIDPKEDRGLSSLFKLPEDASLSNGNRNTLSNLKEIWLSKRGGHFVAIPIALSLGKFDLVEEIICPRYISTQKPYVDLEGQIKGSQWEEMDNYSKAIGAVINKYSIKYTIENIDEQFLNFKYFAIAPIGHNNLDKSQFESKGILAPFIWILKELGIIKQ